MNAPETVVTLDAAGHVIHQSERAIGAILVGEGKLDSGDIEKVMEVQRDKGLRFGEAALHLGLINERDLHYAVAKQYDLPRLLADTEGATSEVVVAHAPFNPRAEEIRSLRTQLLIRWANAGLNRNVLAIASPGRGEGRSYIAANLAVAFAQLGERTLLIDADLRRPRQHRIFEVSDRVGLTTVLSGRAGLNAAVPVSEFGRLSLLPAGALPPNPQELLARPLFPQLLQQLAPQLDVIIIDTPASGGTADAQTIAVRAGAALIVARKNSVRSWRVQGVSDSVAQAKATIVGSVLNDY